MQKLKQELNANPVGANCIRPHFEGITLKNNRGITLIALIITIIVMLILVGVTINVALNGGLFKKAESATKETEEKAILEEMLAMMDITDNGKINSDEIINRMTVKYPTLKYDETTKTATITGKLGTYNYIVSETEIRLFENGKKLQGDRKYAGNLDNTLIIVTLSPNNELTITTQGMVIADKIKSEEVTAPEGVENPENYSNFYKFTAEEIEAIYGISKDGKTLTVVGMGNLTLVDRKEEYPRVYTAVDGNGQKNHIIELLENEIITVWENGEGEVVLARRIEAEKIKECSDIRTLKEEYRSFSIEDRASIEYTKVLLDEDLVPDYVYFPLIDAWTMIGHSYYEGTLAGFIINSPECFYNWDMTSEQINAYVEAAQ